MNKIELIKLIGSKEKLSEHIHKLIWKARNRLERATQEQNKHFTREVQKACMCINEAQELHEAFKAEDKKLKERMESNGFLEPPD